MCYWYYLCLALKGNCLLLGDVMVLLHAILAFELDDCSPEFCISHGLRHKAVIEVRKLRQQLTNISEIYFQMFSYHLTKMVKFYIILNFVSEQQ